MQETAREKHVRETEELVVQVMALRQLCEDPKVSIEDLRDDIKFLCHKVTFALLKAPLPAYTLEDSGDIFGILNKLLENENNAALNRSPIVRMARGS
ncbi:hypothetical protein CcrBL47_gp438 [Caulobacter phage BL47]|nr:hypothetical protein CcrBL47_gp438 [Caulobacter phage BL47]